MDPKGYLRRGRKSMNLIPEGFALKVVRPVSLLSRGAKQRDGTTGNSSRGGSDIVKTDENTTFDGARIGAAFVRGG